MSIPLPTNYGEIFSYDETSPTFLRWKKELIRVDGKAHKCHVGKVAGYQISGKRYGAISPKVACVEYKGTTHRIHKVVWQIHFGEIPQGKIIDHIDGNPWNNSVSNLRIADAFENAWNARKSVRNTSGVKGVYFSTAHKKWVAEITKRKKRLLVGMFDSLESASVAVVSARQALHQEFAKHD